MDLPTLIFDADGVLIVGQLFSEQLERDHQITTEMTVEFFTGPFVACIIGKKDLIEEIEPWLVKWNWKGTVQEFMQYWFRAEHIVDGRIIAIIKELRKHGVQSYLASNQEVYRAEYIRASMGFDGFLEACYFSAELGQKKPSQEFFDALFEKMQEKGPFDKARTLFWDDKKKNAVAAQEAGIAGFHYRSFELFLSELLSYLPDHLHAVVMDAANHPLR